MCLCGHIIRGLLSPHFARGALMEPTAFPSALIAGSVHSFFLLTSVSSIPLKGRETENLVTLDFLGLENMTDLVTKKHKASSQYLAFHLIHSTFRY